MYKKIQITDLKKYVSIIPALLLAVVIGSAAVISGCGGGGGGGADTAGPHAGTVATPIATVTGMAIMRTQYVMLARSAGRELERAAAQTLVANCGTVPTGWVAVDNASVSVSSESGAATTDINGCFSMDIYNAGTKVFTATKVNYKGGTTTLKKAVDVSAGGAVRFVEGESMKVITTVAAMIVEQKQAQGESSIDAAAIEDYVEAIETQDDVVALMNSIRASSDPDDATCTSFTSIDVTKISSGEMTTEQPVSFDASVSGSPVASTGGTASITAKVMAYGSSNSITSVRAVLSSTGMTDISVTMSISGTVNTYVGSNTFGANTSNTATTYTTTIYATDASGVTSTYTSTSLNIIHGGINCGNDVIDTGEVCDDNNTTDGDGCSASCLSNETCGNSVVDTVTGETCDDGNAVTEVCTYGQTSCTVCSATCQSVAGAATYCSDGTTQTANGEQCDDGDSNSYDGCSSTCQPETFSMATGDDGTCIVVPETGGLKCWGDNDQGQVGDGTNINRLTPVDVVGLTSGVTQVAYHHNFVCALTTAGAVKCWGGNEYGGLGNGTDTDSNVPVDVTGLSSGVTKITVGYEHACAIQNGGAKCWGRDDDGRLGDDAADVDKWTPVDVSGLTTGVVDISAGRDHTCAVLDTGAVKCWGDDWQGQLGYGGESMTADQFVPVVAAGVTNAVSVTAGRQFTCVLTSIGSVMCWGRNNDGCAVDGTNDDRHVPITGSGLVSGMSSVSGTYEHACGMTTSNGLRCWGKDTFNWYFTGTTYNKTTAIDITGYTSGVVAVHAGWNTIIIRTDDGEFKLWGFNSDGEIGDGTTDYRFTPYTLTY